MTSSLSDLETRLNARLEILESSFDRHFLEKSSRKRIDRYFFQEGLISNLWQLWCSAVRNVIIASVRGAETKSGNLTSSPFSHLTDSELAYIASKSARNESIKYVRPIAGSHLEPTWGDPRKLVPIANGYVLNNGSQLASSLASPTSLIDLQMCRNACAHISADRIKDIRVARVRYSNSSFSHPSEMMFWTDPKDGEFLWQTWVDEIKLAFELAIA